MSFPMSSTAPAGTRPDPVVAAALLSHAFLWMFSGLLVTAGVAFVVQANAQVMRTAMDNLLPIFFGQLAMVWAIGLG
ncbi:MAG: hypothetical protein EPO00_02855, partial [Chloroflexota bacterium]